MSQPATGRPRRHRLSVADYHRMAEVGILRPDERVELIEGELLDMAPIGSRHNSAVDRVAAALHAAAEGRAIVRAQGSVSLDAYTEPEPDIALLRHRADFYWSAQPQPADVLLIVEVAETTLGYDSDVKLPLYARHRIPEVWLVDIEGRRLTRHRAPLQGAYSLVDEPELNVPVALSALPEVFADLRGLLGY